jgi:predicted component of type VI protein secretion system
MNIGDLQRYLALQAECLKAAKAGKAAQDLQTVADRLAPFAAHGLEAFFAFLERAHTYDTTGVLPVTPAKPVRAKAPPKPKLDIAGAVARARAVYDQAVHLDPAAFEQEMVNLQPLAGLTKPDLLKVAESLELFGLKNRKKDEIFEQIRDKIVKRRGSAQRADMVFPHPV